MRPVARPNGPVQRGSNSECDADSSASVALAAAVSCSEASPCHRREASRSSSRHPGYARLLPVCAARGTRIEAAASWREYLLFFWSRFRAPGNIVHCVSISSLPRRRDAQGFWPVDMRKMARSKSWFTSSLLFSQRLHDFFRRYGNFIDPHSDGIVDRVSHRWHDWQKGPLPNFLCTKGPARIRSLDQLGDHIGHIERRRALVFKD